MQFEMLERQMTRDNPLMETYFNNIVIPKGDISREWEEYARPNFLSNPSKVFSES